MDIKYIDQIVKEIVEDTIKSRGIEKLAQVSEKGENPEYIDYDQDLSLAMEHSMIRPDATPAMVKQFCDEAKKYRFRNVAVAPCFVSMAAGMLTGSGVRVSTAVGFPMGIATTKMKVAETLEVIENGATEIDLPVNVGIMKAGELAWVKEDIQRVIETANKRAIIKVVVDLGALTEEECVRVAVIAKLVGADFLKIAATTRPTGVNADDMIFFRKIVGNEMGLKADGGIKDYKTSLAIIKAGGTTIGASGSVKIVLRK